METLIPIISILLQVIVDTYFIIILNQCLDNMKYTKKQIIFLIITVIISSLLGAVLKPYPIINTIANVLPIFLFLIFITKTKWIKSLLIVILFIVALAITELISVYIAMLLFSSNVPDLLLSPLKSFFIVILQYILLILSVTLIAYIVKKKLKIKEVIVNISFKQALILTIALAIYVLPQMTMFMINRYSYPISFLILNSIQFIVICAFLFFYLKKTIEHEKIQSDLITSELHNKTMATMVDGVRTLKHDYNNTIQALNRLHVY